MIDRGLKGSLYILAGIALVLIVASTFIVRLAIVIFGLYLIYSGIKLRNDQRILFYFRRFRDRF